MKNLLLEWAIKILLSVVGEYLTPEKIDEGKAKLVAYLRVLVKKQTPDFPFDDALVEVIAVALRVK